MNMIESIRVTGSTGNIGGEIIRQLSSSMNGMPI